MQLSCLVLSRAFARGFPALDLIHSLFFGRMRAEERELPDLVGEAVARCRLVDEDQPWLETYLRETGMSLNNDEFRAYLLLYWVLQVSIWGSKSRRQVSEGFMRLCISPATKWLEDLVGFRRAS